MLGRMVVAQAISFLVHGGVECALTLRPTCENIPKTLNALEGEELGLGEQRLSKKLEGKENSGVKTCTTKCVATCTRGGAGAPGTSPGGGVTVHACYVRCAYASAIVTSVG
eukprot:4870828-Pyramimonas_sp.AAC.2